MSCDCNKIQAASITPVLALGSVASPYFVQVNISQRLCFPTCAEGASPVFNPRFSVVSVAPVATGQWVATLHVEGIISYVQCKGGCNCTKQQPLSANFTVPISKTGTAPVLTLAAGQAVNTVATTGCQDCSRNFVSETPLTITVA